MEYVVNNTRNFSAYELAGAAGICKAFMLLADNLGKETDHFGESLNALFDIHISAAKLGLVNKNLDVDPYGMFRTSGPIQQIKPSEVFLGGVHGYNTHPLTEWRKLNAAGRLKEEDRKVILDHYSHHLSSNFLAIGKELDRQKANALNDAKRYLDKSPLVRLFTKRHYPANRVPEGYNDEKFIAVPRSTKKMFARVFAEKMGTIVPEIAVPSTSLKGAREMLSEIPFVNLTDPARKSFEKDLAFEIQLGGDRFDREDVKSFLSGISREDLKTFRENVEDLAKGMVPEEVLDRTYIDKALDYWLENVVTEENVKIAKTESEPKMEVQEPDSVLLPDKESQEELKERLREDVDYECTRVLRTLEENGKMKITDALPAQDMDGNLFRGFNAVRLNAELAAFGSNVSVFVSEKDINDLGVKVLPAEMEHFCTLEDGSRVWNLSQTSYRKDFPDHFRAIESACGQSAMDDETRAEINRFWKAEIGLKDSPFPSEGEQRKAALEYLRKFPANQTGTSFEVTAKATMAYSVATSTLLSKIRQNTLMPDEEHDRFCLPFSDIELTRSFRKGASMYPAYEVMRAAGEMIEKTEGKSPLFQQRQGIDINAVIRHVNAAIRIRNERLRAPEMSVSPAMHI